MPGIARVQLDNAGGGIIVGPGAPTVLADGSIVSCGSAAVPGDKVFTHGEAPHAIATIVTASTSVFAEGRPVAMHDFSTVTCGHNVEGTVPATVQVGL